MGLRAKKPLPVHSIDCRGILTSDQAEACPLCRMRAAAPQLFLAAKLGLAALSRSRTPRGENAQYARAHNALRSAIAKGEWVKS